MAKERPSSIDLTDRGLSDRQLIALVDEGVFAPDVGELMLDGNQLTAESIAALARSEMSYVHALSAVGNPLGDDAAAIMAREVVFLGVRSLVLSDTSLTAEAMTRLFGPTSRLSGPFWIVLDHNTIGDEGIAAIVTSPKCRFLETLSLVDTGATDLGATVIAESPLLAGLQYLDVRQNAIGELGRRALETSHHLRGCTIAIGEPPGG